MKYNGKSTAALLCNENDTPQINRNFNNCLFNIGLMTKRNITTAIYCLTT